MNDNKSSLPFAHVIIPLLIALAALILVSNLDRKFRNPFYIKKDTYQGGIVVRGIPIPLAVKGQKLPPLTGQQIEAIRAELGKDVKLENIQKNKRWYKHPALRSFLILVTCLGFTVTFFELKDSLKRNFG
ncbi:MAG TPA: hypothetical protein PKI34_02930 [Bacteroidales bacterium]|nr:hypothetical protein [Bacteroidales bacterium]